MSAAQIPFALFIKAASDLPLEKKRKKNMIKVVGLSTAINKDMIVLNNKKLSNGYYISKKKSLAWRVVMRLASQRWPEIIYKKSNRDLLLLLLVAFQNPTGSQQSVPLNSLCKPPHPESIS